MAENSQPDIRRRRMHILLSLLGIGAAAMVYLLLGRLGVGIPCLFRRITGIQCPGCGNTRAVIALCRLDFAKAFASNPMFPVEFFYIGWVYCWSAASYLRGKRFSYHPPVPALDIVILVAIVLWGIVRNFL